MGGPCVAISDTHEQIVHPFKGSSRERTDNIFSRENLVGEFVMTLREASKAFSHVYTQGR
jgi:hypothetical protein